MDGKLANRIELAFVLACLGFLIFHFWNFLTGNSTVSHDALNANLPLHHFMAHSLIQGRLPLWNPYNHGGEPFYPLLGHLRLFEPFSVALVWVFSFFTRDTLLMFNWDKFLQVTVNLAGVCLLLRPFARALVSRLCLILVATFSSLMICSFRQDGFLSQFVWLPFLVLYLIRILFERDYRWRNFFAVAVFLGLKWQSYWSVGTLTFLLFLAVSVLAFYREDLLALIRSRHLYLKLSVVAVINLGMMAPNFQLLGERDRFEYPLRANLQQPGEVPKGTSVRESKVRVKQEGVSLDYETIIQTGASMMLSDYLQLIAFANPSITSDTGFHGAWGTGSETCLYIGTLGWIFTLVGLFFSKGRLRAFWLCQFLGFFLLTMGPYGGLHRVLYYVFPPLWFARNTHAFVLIFALPLLYFMTAGIEQLVAWFKREIPLPELKTALNFSTLGFFLVAILVLWASLAMEHPMSLYIPLFLFVGAGAGWLLRKRVAPLGYFLSILAAQFVVVAFMQPKSAQLNLWTLWNFVVPLLIFDFVCRVREKDRGVAGSFAFAMFVAVLATDLFFFFAFAWPHFQQVHPSKLVHTAKTISEPVVFPATRQPYDYPVFYNSSRPEPIYYHALFSKQTSVLTPIWTLVDHHSLDFALRGYRFGSFLVTKEFSDLIYSRLNPAVLEKVFGVGAPLVQFRSNAETVAPGGIVPRLEGLAEKEALDFLGRTFLVEGPVSSIAMETSPEFKFSVSNYAESEAAFTVRASQPGFLLWLDGYDPSWTATVDGISTPVWRANGFGKAVPIPAGEHSVVFHFRPTAFLVSLWLFWGIFLVGSLAFLVSSVELRIPAIKFRHRLEEGRLS